MATDQIQNFLHYQNLKMTYENCLTIFYSKRINYDNMQTVFELLENESVACFCPIIQWLHHQNINFEDVAEFIKNVDMQDCLKNCDEKYIYIFKLPFHIKYSTLLQRCGKALNPEVKLCRLLWNDDLSHMIKDLLIQLKFEANFVDLKHEIEAESNYKRKSEPSENVTYKKTKNLW